MLKAGSRVGIIKRITGKNLELLGYGTIVEYVSRNKNYKIKLDSGKTVHGTEGVVLSENDVKALEKAYSSTTKQTK